MANQKIRQEINILDREISGVSGYQSDRVYFNTGSYNGDTYYFEVVAKNSDSSPYDIDLYRLGGLEASIEVPASVSTYTRYRSSSFTPNDTYPDKYLSFGNSYLSCQAARVVILQDAAAITDTSTQIELGAYEAIDWETGYQSLTYPKYWYYDSAKWDGTVTFDFHVSTINSDSKGDLYTQLEYSADLVNWSAVSGSQITTTSETAIITRATGLTLTDKRWYRIAANLESDMYGATIYNAKIVVNQTDETQITKCQPEYLLINRGNLAASANHDFDTYYDPAEWDEGGGTLNFIHAQDCNQPTSNVDLDYGGTDIDGSSAHGGLTGLDQQAVATFFGSGGTYSTDSTLQLDETYSRQAQTFTHDGGSVIGVWFVGYKNGSPTGNMVCKIYDSTGTPGTNATPTGSALATSDNFDVSTLGGTNDLHYIGFSTPWSSSAGAYCFSLEYEDAVLTNYVVLNVVGGIAVQNRAYYDSSWTASTDDLAATLVEAMDMPVSAQTVDSYIVAV